MKSILVTGADGFIASALIKALHLNNKVYGLVRNKTLLKRLNPEDLTLFDYSDINSLFENHKIDVVIHLATSYDVDRLEELLQFNLIFSVKLFELCERYQVEAFLNTDSFYTKTIADIYQNKAEYTLSKFFFKTWIKQKSEQVKVLNVQLEHVYGPNDNPNKFIPGLINKLKNNESKINLTHGNQKRDFIFVDDVVRGYRVILNNLKEFEGKYTNIELGTGISKSVKDLVCMAKRLTDSKSELLFGQIAYNKNEIDSSVADISNLKLLGFKPHFSLEEGLNLIIK